MSSASLSLRLGIKVVWMGAVLVLLLIILAYWTLNRELDVLARENLSNKFQRIEHALNVDVTPNEIGQRTHVLQDLVLGHDNLTLTIFNHAQRTAPLLTIGNKSLDTFLQNLPSGTTATFHPWISREGANMLTLSQDVKTKQGQMVKVFLTLNRSEDEHLVNAFVKSSLMAIPILLLFIGMGAWWIAQQGLRPLRQFQSVASRVSTEDLTHRIRTEKLPRELEELGRSINFMLHRLDTGVQQLSEFSDDIAHELRAPITNLMGKAQVVLTRERSNDEYRAVLESSMEELERVSQIVSDMLFLANVSHPASQVPFELISLKDEALRVADLFTLSAEENGVHLDITGEAQIEGDRIMVQRAISNLLSNAIRHAPSGSRVSIQISHQEDTVSLCVENPGAGIAPEHLPHLFERFYRVDGERVHDQRRTGLGLAIVRSIMSLHQGSVGANSTPGHNTVFCLYFPKGRTKSARVGSTLILAKH
ncbi:two-component system heavy metal sensor histidine kinase CusS [Pseudomonas duriflava]|uniref:Sensor protein n=1 Tax=Pseudomonas duriflava TaxID=459528 RepID=A0A562PW01_9PSED|nr:heavy metal sensor histidine kinase [Pseudomonas duriflava]TWI48256.1 two-component system heavy metal sensor histidine kinase CusS [Pseudomonas duriflava]